MAVEVVVRGLKATHCVRSDTPMTVAALKQRLWALEGIPPHQQRLQMNGSSLTDNMVVKIGGNVNLLLNLAGGKGGFGSMLRSMAAKYNQQKSTNFNMCRDLSGRRVGNVKEEKELAEWIKSQPAREREQAEQKAAKRAKVLAGPAHRFDHSAYVAEQRDLLAETGDAVQEGVAKALAAGGGGSKSSSSSTGGGGKRTADTAGGPSGGEGRPAKKARVMGEEELDALGAGSGSELSSDDDEAAAAAATEKAEKAGAAKGKLGRRGVRTEKGKEAATAATSAAAVADAVEQRELGAVRVMVNEPREAGAAAGSSRGGGGGGSGGGETDAAEAEESAEQLVRRLQAEKAAERRRARDEAARLAELAAAEKSRAEAERRARDEAARLAAERDGPLDLGRFAAASDLESLGLDRVKVELQRLGMKCGGTLAERCERLFCAKGVADLSTLDASLFAAKKGGDKRSSKKGGKKA